MKGRTAPPVHTLSPAERSGFELAVRKQVPPYSGATYASFIEGCRIAASLLPLSIFRWRDRVRASEFGLIRNVPVDAQLPATPTERHAGDRYPLIADRVIGTIASLFGTLYNIEGKTTGKHIMNLYPVIGDEYTQLGSSKVELEWHVEEAFHPARPTWLALLCIRGDKGVVTKVARAQDLNLEASVIATLREPRFKLRIDETYSSDGLPSLRPIALLSGPNNNPDIVLDPAYTVVDNRAEAAAISAVTAAADRSHHEYVLRAGDLLVFNNRRTVHARSSFHPRMDGSDRWVKRAYILDDTDWEPRLKDGFVQFDTR